MKRIFSFIIIFTFILAAITPISIGATPCDPVAYNPDYIYSDVAEHIAQSVLDFSKYTYNSSSGKYSICVYVDEYNIPASDISVFYNSLLRQRTELFFIGGSISYARMGEYIYYINFSSLYDINDVPKMISAVNKTVDSVVFDASRLPSAADKALFVHNYLVMNTRYNEQIASGSTTDRNSIYTIYGTLVEGDAVCQGYALTFNHIMRRMGVQCDFVISQAMNHGWSLIQLDEKWYHVDPTWDDPTYDMCGKIRYKFFLRSTEGLLSISGRKQHDSLNSANATSTSYDIGSEYEGIFLHNSNTYKSNFIWNDGYWYFTKINSNISAGYDICRTDNIFTTEETLAYTKIKNVPSIWFASESSAWGAAPALEAFDGKLIYTKADEIRICSFDGSNDVSLHIPKRDDYFNIYGLLVRENTLYYELLNSPNKTANGEFLSYTIPLTSISFEDTSLQVENGFITGIHNGTTVDEIRQTTNQSLTVKDRHGLILPADSALHTGDTVYVNTSNTFTASYVVIVSGDTNGDGASNTKDILQIKKYLAGEDIEYPQAADVNGDGTIDLSDIAAISANGSN